MSQRTVSLGAVATGYALKSQLYQHLLDRGEVVLDVGCHDADTVITPASVSEAVAHTLYSGEADVGIMICNFGLTGCWITNKYKRVIACSCESQKTAVAARRMNDANLLCLGTKLLTPEQAAELVDTFLDTQFLDDPDIPPRMRRLREATCKTVQALGSPPETRTLVEFESA